MRFRIIPKVSYVNYRKLYPNSQAFNRWIVAQRAWSGMLWIAGIKHHVIKCDWRRNWVRDVIGA
jgi:hypothetical protein